MWLWLPWVVLVVVAVLGLIVTMGYGRGYVGGGLIFFFFFPCRELWPHEGCGWVKDFLGDISYFIIF